MLRLQSETARPAEGARAGTVSLEAIAADGGLGEVRVIRQGGVAIRIEKGRVIICDLDSATSRRHDQLASESR